MYPKAPLPLFHTNQAFGYARNPQVFPVARNANVYGTVSPEANERAAPPPQAMPLTGNTSDTQPEATLPLFNANRPFGYARSPQVFPATRDANEYGTVSPEADERAVPPPQAMPLTGNTSDTRPRGNASAFSRKPSIRLCTQPAGFSCGTQCQ